MDPQRLRAWSTAPRANPSPTNCRHAASPRLGAGCRRTTVDWDGDREATDSEGSGEGERDGDDDDDESEVGDEG